MHEIATPKAKKRKRNFEKVGNVKIPWCKLRDGRTQIDPRKYGRKRETFADHAEALRQAHKVALEISNGGEESLALTAEDRAAFAHASAEVRKHGVDLVTAVSEWSAVRAILEGRNMLDMARSGVEASRKILHPVTDVVQELIANKSKDDLNGRYFRGLKKSMEYFAAAMVNPIESITPKEIEDYLDALVDRDEETGETKIGPRRRNNVLKEIRHLFGYAKIRGYLDDRSMTAAEKVSIIKKVRSKIGIITPEVMQIHIQFVSRRFTPWLWFNAFSGVRPEELVLTKDAAKSKDPLRWEDCDWDARQICVRVETSKTYERRIPMHDNLYAALAPWREAKSKGPICPMLENGKGKIPRPDHERNRFIAAAKAHFDAEWQRELAANPDATRHEIDFRFPHNAYRHSFASYRLAILEGDMGKLAYEMGNSIKMIKRNYNNPRPMRQAREWFAIYPKAAGNVIAFPSVGSVMQLQML